MEKFKREALTILSNYLAADDLKRVDEVLTVLFTRYEITEKTTDIVVYKNEVPDEIKSFLVSKSIKGLAKSSLMHYKRTLINFASNLSKDVKDVTANDIRLYLLKYEHAHTIGKSALDDIRRVLNSFYKWMVREDIILKNPVEKVDPIKCDKKVRQPLTMLELEQMRNAAETLREKALFETLYSTGCRVSEIINLNKTDIDFNTGRVKVYGKGKKERFCFLNARSQLALRKYLFSRKDNSEALFVTDKQPYNRLGKGSIEKDIKNIAIRAGINRPVFPHLIRHTTATHMLHNGASLAEVQAILGHESPATTQIYAKLDLQNLQTIHQKCII